MNAGFDVTRVAGRSVLWLDSDKIDACIHYFREQRLDAIGINAARGYRAGDIQFIKNFRWLQDVEIVFPPSGPFDMAPLLTLTALRSLTLSAAVTIPLGEFPRLEVFRGMWTRGLELEKCLRLKTVDLSEYDKRQEDLTSFPAFGSLEELALVGGRLRTLRGIGRLVRLRSLAIQHSRTFESLADAASLPALETLECFACRRLKNLDDVRHCRQLRVLRVNGCGVHPSIQFLNEMPLLEEFRFVDTVIEDGNLEPLFRLRAVGFLPKRHYSHTPEQVDAILRRHGGTAIARSGD